MRTVDVLRFVFGALFARRFRAFLLLTATGVGTTSVVGLTALGEGARRYVVREFESLGTHLLFVLPGRSETTGGAPPIVGESARDLTLEDAEAIARQPGVRRVAPIVVGAGLVSCGGREREATVLGSSRDFFEVRRLGASSGRILAGGDLDRVAAECVLGETLRRELFGNEASIGRHVRVSDRRFRVVGVIESRGESIGVDLDELVVIPVGSAQQLFDTSSLFRIIVEARRADELPGVERAILRTVADRHEGEEDVTVIRQDTVVSALDDILANLTVFVAAIAGVSLVVAGLLIMNVMLIAVSQRTTEIGLLTALGADRRSILVLFLAEACTVALLGGATGWMVGEALVAAVRWFFPTIPLATPAWAIVAALGVSGLAGALFGVVPAIRATRLDPVEALRGR